MFSALRQNSLFYILDKNIPTLKVGQVVSVSSPMPLYGQPLNTTVDVTVKVGNENVEFKQLPANLVIANSGKDNVVVSESRESMLQEVESLIKISKEIIDSMPYHENIVSSCEDMLKTLNPQIAREKEQQEKIGTLENKVSGIESSILEIKNMLSNVLK